MKKGIFVAVGIIAVAAVWYVSTDRHADQENAPEKKTVKTVSVSTQPFQETAIFSGFVRGERQADIAAKTGGYLVRLTKEEGDTVRRGETLAILDGSELLAGKESALLSLQTMEQTLRDTEKYYDQKVDEAKTAYDNASGSERESAAEALKSAKRLRTSQLSALKSERASIEGSLLVSEANAANLIVRAPFDGVVTAKYASLGSLISAGMPLYTVAAPASLEIAVSLPADIAARIARESSVSVSDSRGGRAIGTVAALASSADEVSQRSIARIRFSTLPDDFRIGEHVRVSFSVGTPHAAILIPETAIIAEYDDFFVFTAENGQAVRHAVTLGVSAGDGRREILSGLGSGSHVITEGAHALSDRQPIEETYAD